MTRRLFTALALISAVACASATDPARGSIAGQWKLRTVNGSPLPFGTPGSWILNAETLSIADDGRFQDAFLLTIPPNPNPATYSYTQYGAYTREGATLAFVSTGPDDYKGWNGMFDGERFTLHPKYDLFWIHTGDVYVFTRSQ